MDLEGFLHNILLKIFGKRGLESLLYLYRKIKIQISNIPATKKAFLVVGPESHGTHLVTDILINAGCIGQAGNHVPWQPENKALNRELPKPWESELPTDLQPWDIKYPVDEDPIVWRRSLPHNKEWVNLSHMINILRLRAYLVQVVVVTRDPYAALHSQLKWRHIKDLESGKRNISKAYLQIFRSLLRIKIPFILVNYESLAQYPQAQDFLLKQLGLKLPKRRWPVYDGNRKWYNLDTNEELAAFPEAWYPCRASNPKAYFERISSGYQNMEQQTVIFCGLARDTMHSLPVMMKRIERLGSKFKDYKVIIFENDSIDGTHEMLLYWQRINPKVEILTEKLNAPKWKSVRDLKRIEQLAAYRNRYLDHIRSKSYSFDYLIVLDLDIPLGFSYDGIAHSFSYQNWDVMGSNGILVPPYGDPPPIPMFYDAFAFRPKTGKSMSFKEINALKFQRGEAPVPVESSFSGLAIYKSTGIHAGAKYGAEDCEHVVLHQWLHKNGFSKQFLNPNQLVLYSDKQ